MPISDDDFLSILRAEREAAIGFDDVDGSAELLEDRERAHAYYKGDLSKDIPSLPNRSAAVDQTLANVVDSLVPQIVEVLMEENALAFRPRNDVDEAAAQQETDFVNHIFFEQNPGFQILHDWVKSSLLDKTAYIHWYWEKPKANPQVMKGLTQLEANNLLVAAQQDPTLVTDVQVAEDGTYTFVLQAPVEGKICIKNWKSEDVAVSEDTTGQPGSGTYCVFRSFVRRQELLADGFDEDIVMSLPEYGDQATELDFNRAMAGEADNLAQGTASELMAVVEVYYHYIKIIEDGEEKLYRVITGENVEDVLAKDEVERVDAASITPFPNPHHHYGQSMADKVIPVQNIKTALLRTALDANYFLLNQRFEVAQSGITPNTMGDILKNSPGHPIRVKVPGTVSPIQSGSLNTDPFAALEYMSTVAENNTGVMRNAQGLNPDTLHKTASGALSQLSQSQFRTRFICRIIAETGLKQAMLGIHATARENATIAQTVRLSGQWVNINPAQFALREHMDIDLCNAGGRDYDMGMLQQIMNIQQQAVQAQQGLNGPLVTQEHLIKTARKLVTRGGYKNPDDYFPQPAPAQPEQPQDPTQSPEALKLQAELSAKAQSEQADRESRQQIEIARIQANAELEKLKLQLEVEKAQAEIEQRKMEIELKHQIELAKLQQNDEKLAYELKLKDHMVHIEAELKKWIAEQELRVKGARIAADAEARDLDRVADLAKTDMTNGNVATDVRLGGDEI